MAKITNHGLFSPKFRISKLKNLSSLKQLKEENGFTLLNKETSLIGSFNSSQNVQKIEKLKSMGINIFL